MNVLYKEVTDLINNAGSASNAELANALSVLSTRMAIVCGIAADAIALADSYAGGESDTAKSLQERLNMAAQQSLKQA